MVDGGGGVTRTMTRGGLISRVDVYRSHEQLSVIHQATSPRYLFDASLMPPGRGSARGLPHRISPHQQDEVRHRPRPRHEAKNTQAIVRIGRHMAGLLRSTPTDDMHALRNVAFEKRAEMVSGDRKCLIVRAEQQVSACVACYATVHQFSTRFVNYEQPELVATICHRRADG